jgi:hypothetical protein
MSYRIAQDFEYVGKDYWRWWAWIEADDAELDKVKEVAWILHPSFKQIRVVATNRSDNFRLETAGWGTFLLRAEVVQTDGEKRLLKRSLRLEYPEDSETEPPLRSTAATTGSPPRTVYLSYSTQDSRVAAKLRAGLQSAGLTVLDQTRLGAGEPWSETLQRMMAQSAAIVGLVCEDEISPWVSAEIQVAVGMAKPALVVVPAGVSIAGLPREARILQGDVNRLDAAAIAEQLRSLNPE